MFKRKDLVLMAKDNLRRHYWLFVAVCLFAAFVGAEFSESLNAFKYRVRDNRILNENTYIDRSGLIGQGVAVMGIDVDSISNNSLMRTGLAVVLGEEDHARANSVEIETNAKQNESETLGRSSGFFANVINKVTSGGIVFTFIDNIASVVGSKKIAIIILVFLALIAYGLVFFFIRKVFLVIAARIILEGRIYDVVGFGKFAFLIRVRRWAHTAWVLFVTNVYTILWDFTIVGIFVKRYSYLMVPYILAENPDIRANDAITLSRKMMDGYKWKAFCYSISFIGWEIVSFLTMGLVGILYSNPYRAALFVEFYVRVRDNAKEKGIDNIDMLNDFYLYEKSDMAELKNVYSDIYNVMESEELTIEQEEMKILQRLAAKIKGIRGFFANSLGIILFHGEAEREYEEKEREIVKMKKNRLEALGKAYPQRLFTLGTINVDLESMNYVRNYSIFSIIMIFFTICITGWLWEVALHLITAHKLVNRGFLHGPWLPIYGFGSIFILTFLKKFRTHPIIEFFASIILCGVLEYGASYIMELISGKRWWTYEGYFLNINGRICAEGLLVFGVGGVAIVYFVAPMLDNLFRRLSLRISLILCVILLGFLVFDAIYSYQKPNSGKGISSYNYDENDISNKTLVCLNMENAYENSRDSYQEF